MATDLISEVKNADWQFEVGRTYVLGVEIFDQKISANELRLLLALRYRASGADKNFVSYKALSEDLNVHEQTIKKWMGKLKSLGYVTCRKRGYATSTTKTITSMVERYDKDILLAPKKEILGAGRTEETLRRLHNLDSALDDPLVADGLPMEDGGNLDSENGTHEYPSDYPIGSPTATSQVHVGLPKVDKHQVNQNEVDSIFSENRASQPSVESQDLHDHEDEDLHEEDSKKQGGVRALVEELGEDSKGETRPTPDSRPDVDALQAAIAAQAAETARKSRAALDKRRARKEAKEVSGEAEKEREWKKATRAERQTVKSILEDHFYATFGDWFPGAKMGKFQGPEYGKLNHLLRIYDEDYEFIKKAWSNLCENWDEIRRALKIDAQVPTIGIFLGFRETIFAMVQETKTMRQERERKPSSGEYDW